MKSRNVVVLGILVAVTIATGPYVTTIAHAGPASIPSTVEVSVAYADTEDRGANVTACTNCFPSPWCGSSGVQFVGASTNYDGNPTDPKNCMGGDWDGGAILLTNGGTSSITLTGLTVTLPLPPSGNPGNPSCAEPPRPITFDLWFGQKYYYGNLSDPAYDGAPIVLLPGGQAIFTGTSADGAYTCPSGNYPSGPTGGTYDFDTTDANFLGGCTPATDAATAPQVTFTASGYSPTTYVDEGHVIDTGGIDVGNCGHTASNPEWPSESLGWRAVSSPCGEGCPTNQLGVHGSTTQASLATGAGGSPKLPVYLIGATATFVLVVFVWLGVMRRKKST